MRGEKNTFRAFAWKKKGTSLIQIAQNVFLTALFSFFLSISAGQICWGRRIQRSCLCWKRKCSSSGGCGRAWTQVRRSAGRASLSSGQPAAWSRPGGHPSWRMPCRKVRQANRVFIMYLLKVLSHTDENSRLFLCTPLYSQIMWRKPLDKHSVWVLLYFHAECHHHHTERWLWGRLNICKEKLKFLYSFTGTICHLQPSSFTIQFWEISSST